ncbi:MAG TPA: substrate-binding domain-containing protein [Caulobacteraceae bacterium]|nr:substrate-binding domain-containing protein [Caulobacteraceae bacterium]
MVKPGPPGSDRMTMQDLAHLAGVSSITVSRALRDSPLVREELREQIKRLADKHGYRLNAAARNLRTMRAHSVTAVIEMDPTTERPMSEPLVLMVIGGLLQTLTTQGYRLVLTTRAEALRSNVLDADGIILLGQGPNDEAMHQIRRFNLPLVVWGISRPAADGVVFVGSDNQAGGRLVGEHLADLGRRRILFLGDTVHAEVAQRLAGLEAALAGRDIPVTVAPCAFSRTAARAAVAAELARGTRFDAVMACSDFLALGALDGLEEAGLRVPGDVAVTGYDDAAAQGRLTSVRQDFDLAGQVLARKMLDLIAGGPIASEMIPVELVVRSSTQG